MSIEIESLPSDQKGILREHFEQKSLFDAGRLISNSQVSLSFKRGNAETYFIVSGITREDGGYYESKAKYRNESNTVESQCNCKQWNEQDHCKHVAALCLKFFIIQVELVDLPERQRGYASAINAIYPAEYGTMIETPSKLKGDISAIRNGSYFSGQFQLTSGKVINFPIPNEWEGKLIVKLYPAYKFQMKGSELESEYLEKDIVWPIFEFIDETGNGRNQISILENLYLFDWEKGENLHLHSRLKDLVLQIKKRKNQLKVNDYLRFLSTYELEDIVSLVVDDKNIKELPHLNIAPRISIEDSTKAHHLRLNIEFTDDENRKLPLPEEFKLFAFINGMLDTFKKKTDGLEFVSLFVEALGEHPISISGSLRKSTKQEIMATYTTPFINKKDLHIHDGEIDRIVQYEFHVMANLLRAMIDCYGNVAFRYSSIDFNDRSLTFDIRKNFLLENISRFYHITKVFGTEIFYNKKQVKRWQSSLKFERKSTSMNWFELEIDVNKDDLQVIKQANLDANYALTNEGLTLLGDDEHEIVRFMQKYTQYEASKNNEEENPEANIRFHLPLNRSRIFELFELMKLGITGALTDEEIAFCNKLSNLKEMPTYELPKTLNAELRDYQKTGYNWLRFLHEHKLGACLADDMGLGKTLQTISFIESVIDKVDKVLIVCPVSILLNWQNEFKKFTNQKVNVYYGGERNIEKDSKIILTSYGVLKKEANGIFHDMHFNVLIMDEVQNLKNIKSLGANSARMIHADFKICLTGTPVENDLSEFYNILDLSVPGIWGDLKFIKSQSSRKNRLLARRMARPFILRRTKAQVLTELPPRTENNVILNFSEEEKKSYLYSLTKIKGRIETVTSKRKYGEILKGLLELRQLCLWHKANPKLDSTKVEFLVKNLEQITEEGHQSLVFSQFTSFLDVIQAKLDEKHIKYVRIDGSYTAKKRQISVDKFQNGEAPVFLISLKAGGLGLNLTAASYVFLMDPWWNPAVEAQAIDRAHRIGQKNAINVYRLIMKDSVEEKVIKLQERKKELFNELLDNTKDGYFTGKLSMEDFQELLT